jgi:hypothetical protein
MIFKSLVCKFFFFSLILFRNNPIFPRDTRDKSHGSSSNCEYSSNIRRFATNRTLQSSHLFDSIGALATHVLLALHALASYMLLALHALAFYTLLATYMLLALYALTFHVLLAFHILATYILLTTYVFATYTLLVLI